MAPIDEGFEMQGPDEEASRCAAPEEARAFADGFRDGGNVAALLDESDTDEIAYEWDAQPSTDLVTLATKARDWARGDVVDPEGCEARGFLAGFVSRALAKASRPILGSKAVRGPGELQ
jgi:hypothetical protein